MAHHQRIMSPLSLISLTFRAPHLVHGGSVGRASVSDMTVVNEQTTDLQLARACNLDMIALVVRDDLDGEIECHGPSDGRANGPAATMAEAVSQSRVGCRLGAFRFQAYRSETEHEHRADRGCGPRVIQIRPENGAPFELDGCIAGVNRERQRFGCAANRVGGIEPVTSMRASPLFEQSRNWSGSLPGKRRGTSIDRLWLDPWDRVELR